MSCGPSYSAHGNAHFLAWRTERIPPNPSTVIVANVLHPTFTRGVSTGPIHIQIALVVEGDDQLSCPHSNHTGRGGALEGTRSLPVCYPAPGVILIHESSHLLFEKGGRLLLLSHPVPPDALTSSGDEAS